jgi:signal transduction histidine kinase
MLRFIITTLKTTTFVASVFNKLKKEYVMDTNTLALQNRDQFFELVTHDLRNPIGIMLNAVDILLDDPEFSQRCPDTQFWIKSIKRNAELSMCLIREMERHNGLVFNH